MRMFCLRFGFFVTSVGVGVGGFGSLGVVFVMRVPVVIVLGFFDTGLF